MLPAHSPHHQHTQTIQGSHPQTINGKPHYAEYWGITSKQFRKFLEECKQKPPSAEFFFEDPKKPNKEMPTEWDNKFTIADVVNYYVKPETKGGGIGLALKINRAKPLKVSVMISHCWDEEAEDFCRALERSVGPEEVLFICAFSLYQPDDGCGPSIADQLGPDPTDSPFCRVLKIIHKNGEEAGMYWKCRVIFEVAPVFFLKMSFTCLMMPIILYGCVPIHSKCAVGTCEPIVPWLPIYRWHWTYELLAPEAVLFAWGVKIFLLLAVLAQILLMWLRSKKKIYRGRMIAVPNHNKKMYSRLWCVYEMFEARRENIPVRLANSLAPLGDADSRSAECSVPADQQMITEEIKKESERTGKDGHDMIDDAIKQIEYTAWKKAAWTEVQWGWPLALCEMCIVRLLKRGLAIYWEQFADPTFMDRVKFLAAHGRLGFDIFCQSVFEAHKRAFWAWGLVLGVLGGYAVIIGFVTWSAIRQKGRTTTWEWLKCAFGLASCGLLLSLLGYKWKSYGLCQFHMVRVSWVFLGAIAAFFQGATIICLFVLAGKICRCAKDITGRRTNPILAFLSVVMLVLAVLICCDRGVDEMYATFVFNAALIFGSFIGPLAMFWTTALRWDIQVLDRPHGDDGDEDSDTDDDLLTYGNTSQLHFRVD